MYLHREPLQASLACSNPSARQVCMCWKKINIVSPLVTGLLSVLLFPVSWGVIAAGWCFSMLIINTIGVKAFSPRMCLCLHTWEGERKWKDPDSQKLVGAQLTLRWMNLSRSLASSSFVGLGWVPLSTTPLHRAESGKHGSYARQALFVVQGEMARHGWREKHF